MHLDDTKSSIALFQLENADIGYAHLIKDLNGKYEFDVIGYGSNKVSYEEIKTNRGMYGILVGKNRELRIEHITAKLMYEKLVLLLMSQKTNFL